MATYVVKPGDTVSAIAVRYGLDYRELARLNGIGPDYLIYPGQTLRLTGAVSAPRARANNSPAPPAVASPLVILPATWIPPAELARATFVSRPNGSMGLSFGGEIGQEIRAAADGRVIYTGSGLLGFGLLVIVKHNETCLSVYGYTQALVVREGDTVKAGQAIATMGSGPQGDAALYFEIRINGRATDPRPLLPAAAATN